MAILRSRVLAFLVIGVCLVLCVYIGVNGLVDYKQGSSGGITATGSATVDFTSDLIVWRGSFTTSAMTTSEAYSKLIGDGKIISGYLTGKSVSENEFVFSAINMYPSYKYNYDAYGNYLSQELVSYTLTQEVTIQSADVTKIEDISRDITALIDKGVDFTSSAPEYYYTKLGELKLQLIEAATADAKARVDIMAENSGANAGELLSSTLGTFQITAQNSSADGYSSGGTYNTWAREKTMFISVKLHYAVK